MELRIGLAGPLRVETGEALFNGEGLGRSGRLALAYLVYERGRPVSRDELAELLWGEELPRSWDQLVRGVIAKLRVALGSVGLVPHQALATVFGGYQLRPPEGIVVDVEEAGARLAAAEEALAHGEAERARKEAGEAASVAAGGFLPGATGCWVERRQADVAELRLRALETMSQAALAAGDANAAVIAAAQVLDLEPHRETAHLRLIVAHAAAGDRSTALRAYERCRRVLAQELGALPSPALQAAYAALLADAPPPETVLRRPPDPLPLPAPLTMAAGAGVFVGREDELSRLRAAFEQVRRRRMVLVGGEPGAGKTRLAAEFAVWAHKQGAQVLYGRCDDGLDVAYQPFVEALAHYVAHAPLEELAGHVARHGGDAARLVPELAHRLPATPTPAEPDGASDRYRLFAAIADLLVGAAWGAPVVLVLDDLHWANKPALLLLAHLLRASGDNPLLVVGTYRDTEQAPLLAELRREMGVERLTLGGLDETAVASYLATVCRGLLESDPELPVAVHARSQGNAFFVAELCRHLGQGLGDGSGVPEGVRDVVRARLGRLSPAVQAALPLAAVVGMNFSLDVLERLAGAGGDTLLDALEEAAAAGLVVERPDAPGRFVFAHGIVRDTLYSGLSGARRLRLHRSVGGALEALGAARDPSLLPALAYHFCRAAAAGCAAKAADYSLLAARHSMEQAAWEEAAAHVEAGLRALGGQGGDIHGDRRYDLLLALAAARGPVGNAAGARSAGLEAAEEAHRQGSAPRVARAVITALGTFVVDDDATRRCMALARQALRTLDEGDIGLRARLLALLAQPRQGSVSDSDAHEALALARRSEDGDVLYYALCKRLCVLMGSEHPAECVTLAEEALGLAHEQTVERGNDAMLGVPAGQPRPYFMPLRFRAIARLALGDRAGFEADMAEFEKGSRLRRMTSAEDQGRGWRTALALADGRFSDAETYLAHRRRPDPLPWGGVAVEFQVAQLGLEQGRLHEVLPTLLPIEAVPWDRTYHAVLARSHLELGDEASARLQMEAVAELGLEGLADKAMTLACLAEVAARLGAGRWAARLHPLLEPYAGQLVVARFAKVCLGAADRYLAMLTTTLGRLDEGDRCFRAAAELEKRVSAPPLLARTRYWHAELLARRGRAGDRAEAAELLDLVLATSARLAMPCLHGQAEALREKL